MGVLKDSVVVTAMKDEGPFILQWVAWQKMLGFDNILVMHNDCTDHSPQLLRLLERAGVLAQKKHSPTADIAPQPAAHGVATQHPLVRGASWAFVTDVDERLVVHVGDGTILDLLDGGALPVAALAIHWRVFGTMGARDWRDGVMHQRFTQAAPVQANQNACFKSFVRTPRDWGLLRSHGPKFWRGAGDWDSGENVIELSDRSPLADYDPEGKPLNATPKEDVVHGLAQVNHYALQTYEQWAFKKGIPCSAGGEDRYTDAFFTRFDHNEHEDLCALKYDARFEAEYNALTAIPGVLRLHHLCCADFVAAMCEKRGDDPKADARYRFHRDEAKALPRH